MRGQWTCMHSKHIFSRMLNFRVLVTKQRRTQEIGSQGVLQGKEATGFEQGSSLLHTRRSFVGSTTVTGQSRRPN